ncbi:alpha/beta hydrolase [Corynebacterium callunae]|uniref:alpha/beta hydrolase n=1 Tax=Corynebacterium callunae TaxID=1721 RepID=UPI001FFFAA2D|nr:alpha/beta hydrolase fold domain-containing protein [Corynebacterium callunae]MCK2199574.1 alpha/beta hydrolase fold domain-containing protein [Corynebacterium callunae]
MTENSNPSESEEQRDQRFRDEFEVGGKDRQLSDEEQLEQLGSYIDAHYPLPDFTPPWAGGDGNPDAADRYIAHLPDRTTHTAMIMLGSGLDHSMPGVAFIGGVSVDNAPEIGAAVFRPSQPTGRWAVSFHSGGWWRGSGDALEMQWRPEVAAAAELSGTTIVDLDYPLAPGHTLPQINDAVAKAVGYARHHNAASITGWGYSSGAALAALNASLFDALILTFPDLGSVEKLPEEIRAGVEIADPQSWPKALVQIALQDEIATRPVGIEGQENIEIKEYVARHRISTPKIAREKITDVAEFLKNQ